jgi:hypothetical protein
VTDKTIWQDFAALTKAATNPAFDLKNVFFKSPANPDGAPYTSLPAALDHCRTLAAAHNFGFTQDVQTVCIDGAFVVSITSILIHCAGERITSGPLMIRPAKQDPQGIAGSVTYGRRIGALTLMGLAGDPPDDDGNQASGKTHKEGLDPRPSTADVDPKLVDKYVSRALDIKSADLDDEGTDAAIYALHTELASQHDLYCAVADALAEQKVIAKAAWKGAVTAHQKRLRAQ